MCESAADRCGDVDARRFHNAREWTTTSATWTARSIDVTLAAGQTLYLRLGATGATTGSSSNGYNYYTGESHIRNVRYLADQRSLIGI